MLRSPHTGTYMLAELVVGDLYYRQNKPFQTGKRQP